MNLHKLNNKEFELYLLKGNLETLFNCFTSCPEHCLLLVDQLHDMQHGYEDRGEFEHGRVVSEFRDKAFNHGQRLQLIENQNAFVGELH